MRKILLALFLPLTACAAPQPVFKPVTVDMPIAVPCKTVMPPAPASPLQNLTPQAPLFDKTRAALVEIDARKNYEAQLRAALQSCQ